MGNRNGLKQGYHTTAVITSRRELDNCCAHESTCAELIGKRVSSKRKPSSSAALSELDHLSDEELDRIPEVQMKILSELNKA